MVLPGPGEPLTAAILLLLVAFTPPILLGLRLRSAERYRREPWRWVVKAFLWGALGAAALAILVELAFLQVFGGLPPLTLGLSVGTVVVAPLVEEAAKALGLFRIRDRDPEAEDGLVLGGMSGLGFAASENVFYILAAFLLGGRDLALHTAIFRGIATVALHAAATATVGYGVWQARFARRWGTLLAAFLLASALHAGYNALASLDLVSSTLAAGLLAVVAYVVVDRRVRALDRRGGASFFGRRA